MDVSGECHRSMVERWQVNQLNLAKYQMSGKKRRWSHNNSINDPSALPKAVYTMGGSSSDISIVERLNGDIPTES